MDTKKGIKYDTAKPAVGEMIKDFAPAIREIARVWKFGAGKYGKSNWKELEDAENRYTNAMVRHLLAEEENMFDDESHLLHASHVAWNAIVRLWFILLKKEWTKDSMNDKIG